MCDCIAKVDEWLKGQNACLDTISLINFDTNTVRESLRIPTQRRDRSVKKWTRNVIPTFCPFCGVKCRPDDTPAAPSPTAKEDERR